MVAVARGGAGCGVREGLETAPLRAFAAAARRGRIRGWFRALLLAATAVVVSSTVPPFQDFLEANRAMVYRFLMVAVGPNDAEDCFQDTFLSALRAYPRVTRGERLDRWILRIASRKAIDHHRAGARHALPTADPPERAVPTVDPTPDDALWEAVRELPPRQRVAVVHRHVLDRPYAEIADLMGTSEETARANVYQGTKKLREMMR
jgi:RNA polymerase sigma factor (sigma-70 family)